MNLFKQEPVVIVGFVQAVLALVASFGFDLITPEQSAAVVAFTGATVLLLRSVVTSPATAEQLKEQREILARTVKTADTTGSVPFAGSKVAKKVLEGAVDMAVPPGLVSEAIKWGLSQDFVLSAGVVLTRQAIAAAKEAAKRPLNDAELKADRDAEIKRRAN